MVVSSRRKSCSGPLCFGGGGVVEGMRVADLLNDLDDDGEGVASGDLEGSVSSPRATSSPRSLVSRWFASRGGGGGGAGRLVRFPSLFRKSKGREKGEEEEEEEQSKETVDLSAPGPAAADGRDGGSPEKAAVLRGGEFDSRQGNAEVSVSVSSGGKPDEMSFNLGMGVGLVFLLAKSAVEFNKMMELRTQMEMLLKEIKDGVLRKDVASIPEPGENNVSSTSDSCGNVDMSMTIAMQSHDPSSDLEGTNCVLDSHGQSSHDKAFEKGVCLGMDKLEAELEVELERLQVNLEGEDSSVLQGQDQTELASESTDPSSESFSINFEEDNVPKEDNFEHHGVSPHELERRLHELLEARQQQRIVELETALESIKKKLHEKEMELSWLRNTSQIPSQVEEETCFR